MIKIAKKVSDRRKDIELGGGAALIARRRKRLKEKLNSTFGSLKR